MERSTGQTEYRPRIATIFVAAFLGGAAAAIGVNRFLDMRRQVAQPTVECEPIFVATRGIAAGDPVTVWDVSLKDWPKATAPADALRIDDSLEGQFAIRTVREGQPLVRSSIGRQAARPMPSAIEPAVVEEEEPFELPQPPRPPERSTRREDPAPLVALADPVPSPTPPATGAGSSEPAAELEEAVEPPRPSLAEVEPSPAAGRMVNPVDAGGTAQVPAPSAMTASVEAATNTRQAADPEVPHAVLAGPVEVKTGILDEASMGLPARPGVPTNPGASSGSPPTREQPFAHGPTDDPKTLASQPTASDTNGSHPPLQAITARAPDTQTSETRATMPQPDAPAHSKADRETRVTEAARATPADADTVAGGETVSERIETLKDEAKPTGFSPNEMDPAAPASPQAIASQSGPEGVRESTQPPPLRFLVIPERIAALVDGPLVAEAELRTIESTDALLPTTTRSAAPARSASTGLSGKALLPHDRLPGSTVAPEASSDGGSRRSTVAAQLGPIASPASNRGSARSRAPANQRPTSSGVQQPPAQPRTGLGGLFPNVSAGMREIGERLRRTQQ